MRTPKPAFRHLAALLAIAARFFFLNLGQAQTSTDILAPLVSIEASVPQTREPFCDPDICDAAPPAPGVFVVTRHTKALESDLYVNLSYSGTATSSKDYPALPGFVILPAGQPSVELRVEAAYDKLSEGDESVVAHLLPDPTLGPIEHYHVDPAQSEAKVVIHDNEAPVEPVVSIAATSPIAEESSSPLRRLALRGQFTITRTGSTEQALPVFVHYSGSAAPGFDYPFLPWVVTIPAGTNSLEIEVVPNADDLPEPIETLEATLSECPPLTDPPIGIPCFFINIDPAHASARIFIRDDGITTASLEITAPKNKSEFKEGASIDIRATAIDLSGAITHVDFFDGDKKIGDSTVNFFLEPAPGTPVAHQFEWLGAEAGLHTLTAHAINAAGYAVTSAPVRITIEAGLPLVSIEATYPETVEPSFLSRIRPGRFTFRRTGDTSQPLRVWAGYSGSATSGSDYVALPTVVEFQAATASVEVSVFPIDDDLIEGDEKIVAELTQSPLAVAPTYLIDPKHNLASVVIHDNDTESLEITAPKDMSEFKQGAPIGINVTAIDIFGAITHVFFFDGDKLIGESTVNFFLEPDPGTPVLHEFEWLGAAAGLHTLTAHAINAAGNPITSLPVHINIIDGGPPVVSIAATQPYTSEPCPVCRIGPGIFTVTRTGTTEKKLIVFLTTHGSATPGDDYEPLPNSVQIPAGSKSIEIFVAPKEGQIGEGAETVIATLQPDPSMGPIEHYLVDTQHREATVTINDDDSSALVPVVTIRTIDAFAREGANPPNPATFEVRRTGDTNSTLTVLLAFFGQAVNGIDYETIPNEITIPAGSRSAQITVTPIDDKALEKIETIIIQLVIPPMAQLELPVSPPYYPGRPRHAAAILVDSHTPRPPCLHLPDGLFNLCLPVDPKNCYRVEASPDLQQWTPITTIPVNEGMAHYIDPDAPSTRKFYRLVPVSCDSEQ